MHPGKTIAGVALQRLFDFLAPRPPRRQGEGRLSDLSDHHLRDIGLLRDVRNGLSRFDPWM
jgi:hypothetical protein